MTLSRLAPVLVLTLLAAAPAWAGSRGGVGPVPLAGGCHARLDDGVAYRDAGGACETSREAWSGYDQWAYGYARGDCGPCGYGRGRLAVETREGDRYGERREAWYDQAGYAQAGYAPDRYAQDRYGSYGYAQGGCDQCGYDRGRIEIEARDADRYGERREAWYGRRDAAAAYAYEQQRRLCGCAGGYDQGRGGPVYPYPPSEPQGYVTAGRDDYGWLVWAGKRP
ncbi:hypothetical protein [uncultured Caulobacter sp.]|uniref:hypothetical protein n=1 Tax=uncultured Caulobacter sp. TaxID=158749 RepID=UPI0026362AE8|nr:hypothetical protein [uncultured Caulobacter sp.]